MEREGKKENKSVGARLKTVDINHNNLMYMNA